VIGLRSSMNRAWDEHLLSGRSRSRHSPRGLGAGEDDDHP
jgi:hypothetical protein